MQIKYIVIYEPPSALQFYPFALMHPLWELRCGALRLFEKVQRSYPGAALLFHGRALQLSSFLTRFQASDARVPEGDILVLRADVLPSGELFGALEKAYQSARSASELSSSVRFADNGDIFGAFVSAAAFEAESFTADLDRLCDLDGPAYQAAATIPVPVQKLGYLWDALDLNGEAIRQDARYLSPTPRHPALNGPQVCALEQANITVGSNVRIDPFVCIDAREGPVIIGDNVRIMAHSTLIGPCAIGNDSTIKVAAKIYGDTSIGEMCKVGGEVENSIIQSYANKQHEGFLGHSFISEWVNLGADSNTSDLKNNYGSISVRLPQGSINTGRMFLGLLCGDHSKSGINTMFNSGAVVGISANVFGPGYCKSFLPSFSWGCRQDLASFRIEKALTLAKTVMGRRGKILSQPEEVLMRKEYEDVIK